MTRPLLTIFTPAYNRAGLLPRLYRSLLRQTSGDFTWLVIDDGSTDNTRELVRGWIAEGRIPIRYRYKENGGMHTAHNAAYELIDTELNACVDSDDWITDDAVGKIVNLWRRDGSDRYAGIIALDATEQGGVIGSELPRDRKDIRYGEFYGTGGTGDKKLIYRTEVMRRYPPYPVFPGEKYFSLGYKSLLAGQDYSMLILNEIICIVEYQPTGSSLNMISQYRSNPRGFAFIRKVDMALGHTLRLRFRAAIHYVAKSIMLRNSHFLRESPRRLLTLAAIPAGILLYCYLMTTKRNSTFIPPAIPPRQGANELPPAGKDL